MRTALLRSSILLALSLGTSAATAQTELFFATGVDSTGWAQAQSNADGHVLIESPQYPRGLWLHLVDEAGDALAGLQVKYQGRPDSLVAIHCVDPAGWMRETLVWTRAEGIPLSLTLKLSEAANLPARLTSINWQIDPSVESLLEPVEETRLIGWKAVAAFLRDRWQGQVGRVAIQLDASSLAIELGHPEAIETLVDHLRQAQQPADAALGEINPLKMQVFAGSLGLREGVILYASDSLFEDANLEELIRQALGRVEEVSSLDSISAANKAIRSLVGLEHFAVLRSLDLQGNQIVDITPLNQLTNLGWLNLDWNQIVDLSPLNQLTSLYLLDLSSNQIVDITPLNRLTNLGWLDLGLNQIVDITPLNQLTNLTGLYLSSNQIADVTPLAALTNLRTLFLWDNQIDDITPLASLKKLRELRLSSNQVVDLTPLAHLTNLQSLDLRGNQVVDLTPLAHLANLQSLDLDYNQVVDVSPLIRLTNLQWLDLRHNPLSDQVLNEQIPALEARGVRVRYTRHRPPPSLFSERTPP